MKEISAIAYVHMKRDSLLSLYDKSPFPPSCICT